MMLAIKALYLFSDLEGLLRPKPDLVLGKPIRKGDEVESIIDFDGHAGDGIKVSSTRLILPDIGMRFLSPAQAMDRERGDT